MITSSHLPPAQARGPVAFSAGNISHNQRDRPFAVMQATMTAVYGKAGIAADRPSALARSLLTGQAPEVGGDEPGYLLVELAGLGRTSVDRVVKLGPDDGQALALHRGALPRRQRQHGLQGGGRGVERARPEPRDGQVGVREHLAPAAVLLAG